MGIGRMYLREYDEQMVDDLLDRMYARLHQVFDAGMTKGEAIDEVIQKFTPKIRSSLKDLCEFFMIPDLYDPDDKEEAFRNVVSLIEDGLWEEIEEEEDLDESRKPIHRNLLESFLGNRQRGGFDAAKVIRGLKDGKYDSEKVISACVSALEERQKDALAQKLVKQLQADGVLDKAYKKSGEFGTKEQ